MPETTRQLEAYKFYYSMYPRRSYTEVAKKFKISVTAVAKWAKKEHWEQRIAEDMAEEEKNWLVNLSKSRILADEENLKLIRIVKAKALKALQKAGAIKFDKEGKPIMKDGKPVMTEPIGAMDEKDGADALEKIIKLERDILGAGKPGEEGKPEVPVAVTQNIMAVIISEVINGDKATVMRAINSSIRKLKSAGPGKVKTT